MNIKKAFSFKRDDIKIEINNSTDYMQSKKFLFMNGEHDHRYLSKFTFPLILFYDDNCKFWRYIVNHNLPMEIEKRYTLEVNQFEELLKNQHINIDELNNKEQINNKEEMEKVNTLKELDFKTLMTSTLEEIVFNILEEKTMVTTLEVKEKLRSFYPSLTWNQNFVSEAMDNMFQEDKLVYEDNGTFRIYSLKPLTKKEKKQLRKEEIKKTLIDLSCNSNSSGMVISFTLKLAELLKIDIVKNN